MALIILPLAVAITLGIGILLAKLIENKNE